MAETLAEWAMRATPAEIDRANWRIVASGMRKMRIELEALKGGNQSWCGPYLQIAESCGKEPEIKMTSDEIRAAFEKACPMFDLRRGSLGYKDDETTWAFEGFKRAYRHLGL